MSSPTTPAPDAGRTARAALITGAAAGLGRGIAVALARAGHPVAFTCRPGGTPPDRTLELVRAYDPGAVALAADLTDPGAAAALVRDVEAVRGPLGVVVHAVGPMTIRRFERCAPDDYRAVVEGNLGSAVALAAAVLPGMRARRFGRLVFFGMNGSSVTRPARGLALYGAAKAAVVTFARALALEEAEHGISVNVIEPGDIRDKDADRGAARAIPAKNPTGHAGSWEDVAAAVLFATAEENGFLNGMVLGVNGGLTRPHE
ncbi:MAG: SDR family oxidoreductase [Candidatus Eremiobacteraeota bacterium]|nr:SDR family oxidoreductase [Candidatus Eremiobacteraeota bacterium]